MKHFTLHHLWRLAAVLLAILIYPAQVARGAVEIDGIQYNLTASTSRARIAEAESLESDIYDGNLTISGDVSIPEKITYGSKEYTVTNIGKGAFNNNTSITTLTIPSTIEYIGPAAFGNCTGVTDVYCYISDPVALTWDLSNAEYYPPFKADGSTRFHVPSSLIKTYENRFGTSYVTFVGDLDGESAQGLISTFHHWTLDLTNETYKIGTMHTTESNDWTVYIKDPSASANTASMHSNTTENLEKMLNINPSGSNKIEVSLNNMNMFQVSGVVSKIIVNASGGFRTIDAFIGEKNSTTDQHASVTNYSDGYLSDFELTFDGTTEYTDAIITLAFNEVSSMGIHSITIVQEGGGSGGASEITTTFNSQISSDTNYPGNFFFNSEEDKEWHCCYTNYTSDVPIYYTSLDGTGCIMLGNTSPSTSQSFMFENMFSFSGPVQKIIVNAAGKIESISATIQERSDGSNLQEPSVFMEETDYAFKDYVITCDGSSYTDGWVMLYFSGKSPAFIRSITIVVGGSSSGSSTIYTFDGCQDILVNGNYKCATFTTTIDKNWSAAVKDTDAKYSYTSYGNSEATVETCIYVQSNSDVCELNNLFAYSGKIKKIILRLGGGYFDGVSASIRTEGKSDIDEENNTDIAKYISDFQDVEIPFAGTTEYSNAQIQVNIYGSGSFFIHSITIVAEEGEGGESGPATSGTSGDLTWTVTENGTTTVWESGVGDVEKTAYRLTFSGTGSMENYSMEQNADGDYVSTAPWMAFPTITEVVIGEGATNVGVYAFAHLDNLFSVSLPNSLKTIGAGAFQNCRFNSITLPNGLETIETAAFYWCTGLTSVTIPASVTTIGTSAFQGNDLSTLTVAAGNPKYDSRNDCNAIIETATNTLIVGTPTTVIPSDVTALADYAFNNMWYLKKVTIPEGVVSIGASAFSTCQNLEDIVLPSTVTTIGAWAFYCCNYALTKFTIGSGVTNIGKNVFDRCDKLADVYCYADPANLTWTNYSATSTFMANKATKFHVPAGYLEAWQTLFPDINATYVGDLEGGQTPAVTDYKFLVCGVPVTSENCAEITAPGVTGHISYDPATNVLTLQDVTANGENQNWTWALIANDNMLAQGNNLNITVLLKGTNAIINSGEAISGGNLTFVGDTPDASLTVNGRKAAINGFQNVVVDGCILDLVSSERPAIVAGKLNIKNGAYVHLKGVENQLLTEITEEPVLGEGIEFITPSVNFSRKQNSSSQWVWACTLDATPDDGPVLNATEVTIGAPKGATINGIHYSFDPITLQATVVSDATAKYTGDINIPENVTFEGNNYTVTAIDEWAFDECNEVTSITLPSTLTFIGQDAFSYCDNVKELIIPASVTVIGSGAFNGMRGLETLRVEEGNPVYDSRENCNAVIRTAQNEVYGACKNTTYPASVTAMGRAALLNHFELTSIDLPENITYIGFNSMSGAMNATTVRLRGQISHIGPFNFTYYTKLKDFYIYSTQVPAVQSNVFFDEYDLKTDLSQATLHVPAASVEDYKNADVWKDFGEIVAIQDDIADISPITEEKIVEMIKISTSTLDDAIVDEVYYNLDSEKGNGYNEDDDCIVIAETTDMSQIEDKTPGSEEVKEEFKGIILKVDRGKGVLSIDVKTVGDNKLAVQFGSNPPELKQSNEKQTIQFGYNVKRATYIYIYAVSGAAGVKGQFLAPTVENGVNIYGFSIDPTIDEIPENIPVVDEEQIATSIVKFKAGRDGSGVYDTSGRRIGKAKSRYRGVYITNGQKVVVR